MNIAMQTYFSKIISTNFNFYDKIMGWFVKMSQCYNDLSIMVYCFKLHEGSGLCLIFRFVFCIVQFEIAIKSIKYTSRDMLSSD